MAINTSEEELIVKMALAEIIARLSVKDCRHGFDSQSLLVVLGMVSGRGLLDSALGPGRCVLTVVDCWLQHLVGQIILRIRRHNHNCFASSERSGRTRIAGNVSEGSRRVSPHRVLEIPAHGAVQTAQVVWRLTIRNEASGGDSVVSVLVLRSVVEGVDDAETTELWLDHAEVDHDDRRLCHC